MAMYASTNVSKGMNLDASSGMESQHEIRIGNNTKTLGNKTCIRSSILTILTTQKQHELRKNRGISTQSRTSIKSRLSTSIKSR